MGLSDGNFAQLICVGCYVAAHKHNAGGILSTHAKEHLVDKPKLSYICTTSLSGCYDYPLTSSTSVYTSIWNNKPILGKVLLYDTMNIFLKTQLMYQHFFWHTHFGDNDPLPPACQSPQFHSCSYLDSSLVQMSNYIIRFCLWAICMLPAGVDREQGYFYPALSFLYLQATQTM